MNILIIEDEVKTAKELKAMVERLDDRLRVVAILSSINASIEWLQHHPVPDLIFSDIQLADGLSFDIFHVADAGCPVIFCTAFDSYAIRAFEANGIDYLLKPIDEGKLEKSLRKYERLKHVMGGEPEMRRQMAALLKCIQPNYKNSLLVYRNEKIIPLKTSEVAFIHSAGGTVSAYTKGGRCYIIREVLDDLAPLLDPYRFFKANRQFIINRDVLVMAEHYFNRRLVLKLSVEVPERVIVSKLKAPEFLKWMEL
ncbi:DNA-binding response regulator, LytR/AlgR family [Parapedobacter composti]|uniref:DNA-binding response regulator, LytR/AlgR family n=1 Tax=Parapedobacter composti TaxID=623281 RepID=A0A1I1F1W5_9SPHI|nr:LytTR family DNA-binding domain-containing protein [Parapedobacter composti]SFB92932.1 DNA-binding response regulator, LytR/AlgR family [Parapedobacter composti]